MGGNQMSEVSDQQSERTKDFCPLPLPPTSDLRSLTSDEAELEATRELALWLHTFVENVRTTAPLSPADLLAADRADEALIEMMRKACDELAAPGAADLSVKWLSFKEEAAR